MVEWRSVVGWGRKKRERDSEIGHRWKNGLMKENEERGAWWSGGQ